MIGPTDCGFDAAVKLGRVTPRNAGSNREAATEPLPEAIIPRFLAFAADKHKLDDGEQLFEIDRLVNDFLRIQGPGFL